MLQFKFYGFTIQTPINITRVIQFLNQFQKGNSKVIKILTMKLYNTKDAKKNQEISESSDSYDLKKGEKQLIARRPVKKIVNNCVIKIMKEDGTYEIIIRQDIKKTKTSNKNQLLKNSKKFHNKFCKYITKQYVIEPKTVEKLKDQLKKQEQQSPQIKEQQNRDNIQNSILQSQSQIMLSRPWNLCYPIFFGINPFF